MKKAFLMAVWAPMCLVVFVSQNSYASSHKEVKDPDRKTTEAMQQDFPQARQITWTREGENFVATFDMYESKVTASYDREGRLLSTLILLSSKKLPFDIRTKLAQKYPDYDIQCVKQYTDKRGSGYFLILKKQEGDRIRWLNVESNGRRGFTTLQSLVQPA